MSVTTMVQPPSGSGSEVTSITWPLPRIRRAVAERERSAPRCPAMKAAPSAPANSSRPAIRSSNAAKLMPGCTWSGGRASNSEKRGLANSSVPAGPNAARPICNVARAVLVWVSARSASARSAISEVISTAQTT